MNLWLHFKCLIYIKNKNFIDLFLIWTFHRPTFCALLSADEPPFCFLLPSWIFPLPSSLPRGKAVQPDGSMMINQ